MNQTLRKQNPSASAGRLVPVAALDQASIVEAYRRWAGVYDTVFGGISSKGRLRAVSMINRLPGTDVLEVGVGTGLALPHYNPDKRVTGIDLSKEMLRKAREGTRKDGLTNVQALHVMDAEATSFDEHAFDIAVGMFVASVVPNRGACWPRCADWCGRGAISSWSIILPRPKVLGGGWSAPWPQRHGPSDGTLISPWT